MKLTPILVVIEFDHGAPSANSIELLAAAKSFSTDPQEIIAVCLCSGFALENGSILEQQGADRVVLVDDPLFEPYQADAWVAELAGLADEFEPGQILFPHSFMGMDAAPRLAFRLDSTVVTGCVGLEILDGRIHWTRSCYGGNAREVVSINTVPAVATISEKSFDPLPAKPDAHAVIDQRPAIVVASDVRARITAKSVGAQLDARLETANTVVSGGRGIGGPQQFEQLSELAGLLGGAVGASRVACDLGWCPASWQVGLSGKTVKPDLYFALGISGAPQHLAGCGNSNTIVAVNTDTDAEIFKVARIGIVADCSAFLPAFVEEVRKIRSGS